MCGIAGIYGHPKAGLLSCFATSKIQNRGQDSAGIVCFDGDTTHPIREQGLLSEVITKERLSSLHGNVAVTHVRYRTQGKISSSNIQPLVRTRKEKTYAYAHNGQFVNAKDLRAELEDEGSIFDGTADTELLPHLISRARKGDLEANLIDALLQIKGSYSLIIASKDTMIAARDPLGVRPLAMGKLSNGATVFASESCAFQPIGAVFSREVQPGEIIIIDKDGFRSCSPFKKPEFYGHCVIELIYFMFIASNNVFGGFDVRDFRRRLGIKLAERYRGDGDCTIPIPNSGIGAAIGFAAASGIPFDIGFAAHTHNRTFIKPNQEDRAYLANLKLSYIESGLSGRRPIFIEDSIIRGTIRETIRQAFPFTGALCFDLLSSAPPIKYPCHLGIYIPTCNELIHNRMSVGEMEMTSGARRIQYQTLEDLQEVIGPNWRNFCFGCMTGKYPIAYE